MHLRYLRTELGRGDQTESSGDAQLHREEPMSCQYAVHEANSVT